MNVGMENFLSRVSSIIHMDIHPSSELTLEEGSRHPLSDGHEVTECCWFSIENIYKRLLGYHERVSRINWFDGKERNRSIILVDDISRDFPVDDFCKN